MTGATTENPSFSLNKALLSRCKTVVLKALSSEALVTIMTNAVQTFRAANGLEDDNLKVNEDALAFLSKASNGDARSALNCLQLVMDKAVTLSQKVRPKYLN